MRTELKEPGRCPIETHNASKCALTMFIVCALFATHMSEANAQNPDSRGGGADVVIRLGQGFVFDDYIDPEESDYWILGSGLRIRANDMWGVELTMEFFNRSGENSVNVLEEQHHLGRLGLMFYPYSSEYVGTYLSLGGLVGALTVETRSVHLDPNTPSSDDSVLEAGFYFAAGLDVLAFDESLREINFLATSELRVDFLFRDLSQGPARAYVRESEEMFFMLSWNIHFGVATRELW